MSGLVVWILRTPDNRNNFEYAEELVEVLMNGIAQ